MQKLVEFTIGKAVFLMFLMAGFSQNISSQGRYGVALSETSIQCLSSKKGNLYQGIDNYLKVDTGFFVECEEINVISSNGIALWDSANQYLLIPERAGKLRLSVGCVQCGQEEVMGYRYFNVTNVPEPQLMLDGVPIDNPASLPKSRLLTCDSLSIFFNDDLVGSSEWMLITDFQLGYNYGGFHVSHFNPSNKLSHETREIISRLGPDHEISIRATVKSLGDMRKQLPIYRIRIY
ncbi:MAG: hypothetical protein JW801_00040 [Bacteroidales bacterium]|nr:hypothetical protein [Bacteroidales bacterium]